MANILNNLSRTMFQRLKAAQMDAAQVWNRCCELHKQVRTTHTTWPGEAELRQATKKSFALHSQSVQMIVRAFLANIDATCQLGATHPEMRMKYPWKTKRFYPVHWPAQAVSRELGVWPRYRLSDPQEQASLYRELHWLGTRNEQPVSGVQASTQAQRQSVEVQEVWVCGASRRRRQCQYA